MGAEMGQQQQCAQVALCRGVDAVGGCPLLMLPETPKGPPAQLYRVCFFTHVPPYLFSPSFSKKQRVFFGGTVKMSR